MLFRPSRRANHTCEAHDLFFAIDENLSSSFNEVVAILHHFDDSC